MRRVLIALALIALALPAASVAAQPAPPPGVIPVTVTTDTVGADGTLSTLTVTTYGAPARRNGAGNYSICGTCGGGGGYSCADASRTGSDSSGSTATAWIHACFDGRGHLVGGTSGGQSYHPGCCEPFTHVAGWTSQGVTTGGNLIHSWGTLATEWRAYAVFGMVTYYTSYASASISVDGWGNVGG